MGWAHVLACTLRFFAAFRLAWHPPETFSTACWRGLRHGWRHAHRVWEERFVGDKLIIGRFCAIARGVKFIMNGANHKLSGISTYPFQIFGNGWEKVMPEPGNFPCKGDTVIGHDVWIGYDALIMPGVRIGNGAVVAARSVVAGDVPAHTIVGGNPARPLKQRFPSEVVEVLEEVAWRDWPVEKITRHLGVIMSGDVDALRACAAGV